jgi:sarcosine oxidase subunit beta
MQRETGLDVTWLEPPEAVTVARVLAAEGHRGGSFLATDGAIDAPRNVRAYSLALQRSGVEVRERTPCTGLRTHATGGSRRVAAVETAAGPIATERVIVTGGPELGPLGRALGMSIPVGGVRHQVAVTEPHEVFEVDGLPMAFDVGAGLYWRLEEGGLLFGMSNPSEPPGIARAVDWAYLRRMRRRLARLVPATRDLELRKVWAATIDYTPDHLPIVGPALSLSGEPVTGATIACAGGHGMMWGPAVARAAADLALRGSTDVVDVSGLGLDRFDSAGRSRSAADPVALPFPTTAPGGAGAGDPSPVG